MIVPTTAQTTPFLCEPVSQPSEESGCSLVESGSEERMLKGGNTMGTHHKPPCGFTTLQDNIFEI